MKLCYRQIDMESDRQRRPRYSSLLQRLVQLAYLEAGQQHYRSVPGRGVQLGKQLHDFRGHVTAVRLVQRNRGRSGRIFHRVVARRRCPPVSPHAKHGPVRL